ncbi:MAG: hypothetical protein R2764_10575 [Bacteroidales bacterium]
MIKWDLNKRLWRNESYFFGYLTATTLFNVVLAEKPYKSSDFLTIANELDDIMQAYEKSNGQIEDPMFFFAFATVNALFLQMEQKSDEMGSARIGYVVNGYKEGLTKHVLYPSYTSSLLEIIFDKYSMFANETDQKWLRDNKYKFVPYEINTEN